MPQGLFFPAAAFLNPQNCFAGGNHAFPEIIYDPIKLALKNKTVEMV